MHARGLSTVGSGWLILPDARSRMWRSRPTTHERRSRARHARLAAVPRTTEGRPTKLVGVTHRPINERLSHAATNPTTSIGGIRTSLSRFNKTKTFHLLLTFSRGCCRLLRMPTCFVSSFNSSSRNILSLCCTYVPLSCRYISRADGALRTCRLHRRTLHFSSLLPRTTTAYPFSVCTLPLCPLEGRERIERIFVVAYGEPFTRVLVRC